MPDLVDVGHGVWVGNRLACDAPHQFGRVIHLCHGTANDTGVCRHVRAARPGGLTVTYTDGNPLGQRLASIAEYSAGTEPLLCHCAAGQCRGPTAALIAKVARGVVPWHAMHDITAALWLRRRVAPHWCPVPLAEIFAWWEQIK